MNLIYDYGPLFFTAAIPFKSNETEARQSGQAELRFSLILVVVSSSEIRGSAFVLSWSGSVGKIRKRYRPPGGAPGKMG